MTTTLSPICGHILKSPFSHLYTTTPHAHPHSPPGLVEFKTLEPISVKGKTGKINIFQPYPKEFHEDQVVRAPGTGALGNDPPPNTYGAMHRQQLRNVAVYKSASTVHALVNPGGGSGAVAGGKNRRYSIEPNRAARNTLNGPLSQDGGGGSLPSHTASYVNLVSHAASGAAAEDDKAVDDGKPPLPASARKNPAKQRQTKKFMNLSLNWKRISALNGAGLRGGSTKKAKRSSLVAHKRTSVTGVGVGPIPRVRRCSSAMTMTSAAAQIAQQDGGDGGGGARGRNTSTNAPTSFSGGRVHGGADGVYLNTLVAVPRDGLLDLNTMHDDDLDSDVHAARSARSARPLDSATNEVHFLEEIPRSDAPDFLSLLEVTHARATEKGFLGRASGVEDDGIEEGVEPVTPTSLRASLGGLRASLGGAEDGEFGGGFGASGRMSEVEFESIAPGPHKYLLHIRGTRSFLPRYPFNISRLPEFIASARGDMGMESAANVALARASALAGGGGSGGPGGGAGAGGNASGGGATASGSGGGDGDGGGGGGGEGDAVGPNGATSPRDGIKLDLSTMFVNADPDLELVLESSALNVQVRGRMWGSTQDYHYLRQLRTSGDGLEPDPRPLVLL